MAKGYVPRILLCGAAWREDMAVEVVGRIAFTGSPERGENYLFAKAEDLAAYVPKDLRIFLDGAEISADNLRGLLDGKADYIVFENADEFCGRYNDLTSLKIADRFITAETLLTQARHNFYSPTNMQTLADILRDNKLARVLDLDGLFAETDYFLKPDLFPTVDAVGNFAPIHDNFYRRIYPKPNACRLKTYDAVLIAERAPADFLNTLIDTDDVADNILTFARRGSELEGWLAANERAFAEVTRYNVVNGDWVLLKKRVRADFCVWVVTHKDAKLDALPDGYRLIHAGHAQAEEDFGYIGDDTGDNISGLNPYINEVTAHYWLWKHTNHAIIGLNHYRRFFTTDGKTFLTEAEARSILRDYDIIVAENVMTGLSVSCWQKFMSGGDLERFVAGIFRKHITIKQPDYLDAFERVANAHTGFQYEMFLTRRKVFAAYCDWLFSFLLDVTEEIFAKTNIRQITNPRKYRVISFFAERLLTVWLWRNPLRIKRLPVLFRAGV